MKIQNRFWFFCQSKKNIVIFLIFFLLFSYSLSEATETRISSMGGISIGIDDLESDPFRNPAKAVFIKDITTELSFSWSKYNREAKMERKYNEVSYDYRLSDPIKVEDSKKLFNYRIPVILYVPLNKLEKNFGSSVVGFKYSYNNQKYNSYNLNYYNAQWEEVGTNKYVLNYDKWDEKEHKKDNIIKQNNVTVLYGVNLWLMEIGILYNYEISKDERVNNIKMDNYNMPSPEFHETISNSYTTNRNWLIGIVIKPFKKIFIESTIGFINDFSSSEITNIYTLNGDFIPGPQDPYIHLEKGKGTVCETRLKYRLSESFVLGLQYSYSVKNTTKTLQDKGDSLFEPYNSTKINKEQHEVGIGFCLIPTDQTTIGMDTYAKWWNIESKNLNSRGEIIERISEEHLIFLLRIGIEQWLFERLVVRLGAQRQAFYYKDEYLTENKTYPQKVIDEEYRCWGDYFTYWTGSCGLGYKIIKNLLVEYGYCGSQHIISMSFKL